MSDTIKWGVLGTAGIAAGCTIPGMQRATDCALYAIAGRNPDKVREFQQRFGFTRACNSYDDLLADQEVQAVYIPLPNNLHCEWVIKALNAGKHVLCEKPIAINETELRRMYRAARDNHVHLMEAYAYLHSPYMQTLRDIVRSGRIGDIDYIDTAFLTQDYSDDFRLHKAMGGGGIYDVGCYCTTMILSLIEQDLTYIKADAELNPATGVDHMASVLLGFAGGARATFNVGMALGTDSRDRYDRLFIHGSRGYIRSDVEYNQEGDLTFTIVEKNENGERIPSTCTVTAASNYTLELQQFNRAIRGEEEPFITEDFSLRNMRLLDRLLDAAGYTTVREEYILNNGVAIPAVGYGSFRSTDERGADVITEALQAGYRYIDTATFYFNEEQIGQAIAASGIPRHDLFLCSKIWPTDFGTNKTLDAFEQSCRQLGTDHLDMLLLHWPRLDPDDTGWITPVRQAWTVLEDLYDQGRIRAIGVSNFLPHHLRPLLQTARIRPMVDQLELHVGYMQEYTLDFLRQEGILPQAWSPLGRARLLQDEHIARIARRHGVTNAQILLRYLLERGIPVIPKASAPDRMRQNLDLFGFSLTPDEISYLSCLPERGWSGEHPDLPREK